MPKYRNKYNCIHTLISKERKKSNEITTRHASLNLFNFILFETSIRNFKTFKLKYIQLGVVINKQPPKVNFATANHVQGWDVSLWCMMSFQWSVFSLIISYRRIVRHSSSCSLCKYQPPLLANQNASVVCTYWRYLTKRNMYFFSFFLKK